MVSQSAAPEVRATDGSYISAFASNCLKLMDLYGTVHSARGSPDVKYATEGLDAHNCRNRRVMGIAAPNYCRNCQAPLIGVSVIGSVHQYCSFFCYEEWNASAWLDATREIS